MFKKLFFILFLYFSFLPLASLALAQNEPSSVKSEPEKETPKIVKAVEVVGNKATSTSTIMTKIKTRVGEPYFAQSSRDDRRRLYETGYFADVSLVQEDYQGGLKIIFKLVENPLIEEIKVEGNYRVRRPVILKEIKSKSGQYFNDGVLKLDVLAIKKIYEKNGIPDAQINYAIDKNTEKNKVTIIIKVRESKLVKIRKMYVDNNLYFSDRRIIGLIKTRQKNWINPGFFKEDQFNDDLERIKSFYLRNGYLDIKVDYKLDYDTRQDIYLRIIVDEGKQYVVGSIVIEGNDKISEDDIRKTLKSCPVDNIFTYDSLKEDSNNIKGLYFGKGYISVEVKDSTYLDVATGKVAITYSLVENDVAYVERIEIRGNIKTQDKVIRRELRIKPGEKFDGDKLKRSKERLYNLGFFQEINYDTDQGSEPDKRNLIVDVKEAKTGSFSFGGGYSSIDQFVGFAEIEQKNFDWRNWKTFTGAGQDLKLRAEAGSVRQNYELSFTDPWMWDHPVSFGFDVYKREHDKDSNVGYGYKEVRSGGDLRLGKDLSEYIKGGLTYRLEQVDISDVDSSATQDLKSEEGKNLISSLEFSVTRDTTDNVFNPTRGLVLSGSYEVAGGPFGGDKDFNKLFGLASQYVPLFAKGVLQFQARAGMAQPFRDQGTVPIYERFYAGGANTIRGYEERSVGPVDPVTDDPLGGEALLVGNIELTVPIVEFIKGALFIDSGNVWSKASDFGQGGFKTGVGFGVRINTPIGPLKLDYGIPLNKQPGKESKEGRFHFSMSHGF
jgi:outer membrane protein insertion porin family